MVDILLYMRGGENEELRYALRTWEENLEFGKLYAVGGPKPEWFEPDIYVENPTKHQVMRQCYKNLEIALNDDRLSENVLLMMDDIFILDYIGEWTVNYNRGKLEDQHEMLIKNFGASAYSDMVRNTLRYLIKRQPEPLSFEEHAPFLCNRKKLWDILKEIGAHEMDHMLYRSIYGNQAIAKGEKTEYKKDIKINNAIGKIPNQEPIISTNEVAFGGNAGTVLKEWYPNPSKFEK